MKNYFKSIKSPLQMAGFYLAWIETALAAGLWPLKGHEELLPVLLYTVVGVAIAFAGAMIFILVYLVIKDPHWLFNPSDYDPSVQDELFDGEHDIGKVGQISNPYPGNKGEKKGVRG
ncbi:hypothetical protein [Halothermothrix orenii]|uniref:Uncharacterized protein n=1 Tax=Halothermothrix orenii (strain H 168 / OCM 544 / DSM 9562) TaxID=373903 RepID=B8D169_HALOH|nr:hypothetical protein [Halothermothrix orenii]ACL71021.1 hypothetical protein Hore_22760 [Halothermothrix orenii H 168]